MTEQTQSSVKEVARVFLTLGLTSFGGPVAHLAYFRTELVQRRQWLSDAAYADLVALCQFLPGPASSQVGFALGWHRAGFAGALLAWLTFTLPSALIMLVLALTAAGIDHPVANGVLHGLHLVAVAVIAHAVWGMSKNLCPDRLRMGIAWGALTLALLIGGTLGQLAALALGVLITHFFCSSPLTGSSPNGTSSEAFQLNVSNSFSKIAGGLFIALLVLPWLISGSDGWLALFDSFYRAGALVFGGGHVVLPLLEAELVAPGWLSSEDFLTGYAGAQAVPGPLFTFAAFLGPLSGQTSGGVMASIVALIAIFLPGFLLLAAVLPHWQRWSQSVQIRKLLMGANAAVVGLLAAALYQPVWISAISTGLDISIMLLCFLLLQIWQKPAWMVVIVGAILGGLFGVS
ncbi:MAG: chromate efflux transporter [Oceanobacter sp.]